MPESAGPQLFYGAKPVFVRRSLRAASVLPELMRQNGRLIVSEWDDTVSGRVTIVSFGNVLVLLPGMLVSGLVLLFTVLLANNVGMCRTIVQFVGTLVFLVMRSVVKAFGHNSHSLHLPRLVMGFLRWLVSVIRIFQPTLRMPALRCLIPFFIVFSGSTMSLRRQVMLLGGSPVCFVCGFVFCVRHSSHPQASARYSCASSIQIGSGTSISVY